MLLSIIIPTYNEVGIIESSIQIIKERAAAPDHLQIIVADGGSDDQTAALAKNKGAEVIHCSIKRRSVQLNKGAQGATGDVFYFLHADSHPPDNFDVCIAQYLNQGYDAGCFQLTFDSDHPLLAFYGWCTRFNNDLFRFGDQSLFVKRDAFLQIGGYRDGFYLLEDQDIVRRIKKEFIFAIADKKVVTSARKYQKYGAVKLQLVYALIVLLYRMHLAQPKLYAVYKKWVGSE